MARRYSSTYSPGASGRSSGQASKRAASAMPGGRRHPLSGRGAVRADVRARFMYILPAPLLFAVFWDTVAGDLAGTGLALGGFVLLMAAAWFVNEGVAAQRAYDARAVARRPAFPRKIIAAVLAGLGVGVAQLAQSEPQPLVAAGFGAIAFGAHLFAFGIDPLSHKGIDVSDAAHGRLVEALDKADQMLREIHDAAQSIGDREITERLAALGDEVRAMLRRLESDPRDLPRARRYLSVHLVGAHEATRKYAENHAEIDDPTLRADFLALITELEESFQRGRDKLLSEERTDLEIEIEVLRERLSRETPRP